MIISGVGGEDFSATISDLSFMEKFTTRITTQAAARPAQIRRLGQINCCQPSRRITSGLNARMDLDLSAGTLLSPGATESQPQVRCAQNAFPSLPAGRSPLLFRHSNSDNRRTQPGVFQPRPGRSPKAGRWPAGKGFGDTAGMDSKTSSYGFIPFLVGKVHFHFAQFFQGMVQTGFHRANGTVQDRRHVRQRSILKKAQQNDARMFFRQQLNALTQLREGFIPGHDLRRG